MDDIHRERLQATKFVENNKSISLDFAFERQPENELVIYHNAFQ